MRRLFVFMLFCVPALLFAQIPGYAGNTMGPNVSVYKGNQLKWEEGSHDYFVMFKSMLENKDPANDNGGQNPQADTCRQSATYALDLSKIPDDALVESAFLIWISNGMSSNLNAPTDNSVTLNFVSDDSLVNETATVTADRVGILGQQGNTGQQDFEFEGMRFDRDGDSAFDTGYYTYRKEVTDFFNTIHQKGREAGQKYDGMSLLGKYTLSDLQCYNDEIYTSGGAMIVAGWALVIIYKSEQVKPKKIYMYNGFKMYVNQEAPLNVTGFELPDKPAVRTTLIVNEGDPNLVDFFQATFPESLAFKGQSGPDWLFVSNACNPPKMSGNKNYTEIYNSISSVYGWQDTDPTCTGGTPPVMDQNTMEWAMDVDTFFFSAENQPFDQHLKRGDTSFQFKVSANADVVITNFLVVSVDTRAPKFDIPVNPNTPNGREKHYCSCAPEADAICLDRPFYYTIKIQNWGDNTSEQITVQDQLPSNVDYVAGTTELATKFDDKGNGTDWTKIEDGAGGTFPLTTAQKVADSMYFCDKGTYACTDAAMIRFKVTPKPGLPKNVVIENTAIINDSTNIPYKTNTTVPLRLRAGNCPSMGECAEPNLATCGGFGGQSKECEKPEDCGSGMLCENNECKKDSNAYAFDTELEIARGANSPVSESSIVIPKESDKLVVGQFTLKGNKPGISGKFFSFDQITLNFSAQDSAIMWENIKIYHDKNGNGKVDTGEPEIAAAPAVSNSNASASINKLNRAYEVNKLHYFLIVLDASYNAETIPANTTFFVQLESQDSIGASDAGTVTKKGAPVKFATFQFEPSNAGFVITQSELIPSVPPMSEMNKDLTVLHLRTKSVSGENAINSLSVRVPGAQWVKFGQGIASVSLWLDTDNDGAGDQFIATSTDMAADSATYQFNNLGVKLTYTAGETKMLVVKCKFSLSNGQKALIEIPSSGLKLKTTAQIIDLPIRSKEYVYSCEPGDTACADQPGTGEEDGCGCSIVNTESSLPSLLSVLFLAMLALPVLLGRRKSNQ